MYHEIFIITIFISSHSRTVFSKYLFFKNSTLVFLSPLDTTVYSDIYWNCERLRLYLKQSDLTTLKYPPYVYYRNPSQGFRLTSIALTSEYLKIVIFGNFIVRLLFSIDIVVLAKCSSIVSSRLIVVSFCLNSIESTVADYLT